MSISEKLIAVQSQLKAPKQQNNDFGHYKYRSCEDIVEAVKPLLKKNGLILVMEDDMVVVGERYYIKSIAKLIDMDGESIQTQAFAREPLSLKGQSDSQITGTASSYARKYALNGLFAIDDSKLDLVADPDGIDDYNQSKAVSQKNIIHNSKKPVSKVIQGTKPVMASKEQITGYQDLIGILKTDDKTVLKYINNKMNLKVNDPKELTEDQMDSVLRYLNLKVEKQKAG